MAETNENKDFRSGTNRSKTQRNGTGGEGLSNYVFGKVQPQALPLEEAVLGALMLDREALPVVMDILRPESFYHEAHQHIYRAIIRLFERSNPVDILTVTEELRKTGELDRVGGSYYLVDLTNRVASAANIEYHARIIAQKHIQRELIQVSTRTIKDAYEDTTDVFTLLDDAEKGLFAITQNNLSRTFESMGSLSSRVLKQVEELSTKTDGLTGVPSGFTDLDRITSGWQPSDLVILAARPGMGKTSCVLAMALNAARDFGKGVALFSLEMASTQLVQRLISMESEIAGSKMRNGKLEDYEWQQLQTTVERLSSVPIFIDDTPGINIFELRAKCRRLKMQHNIQLVIIDYLQLMTGASENTRNANREQEIAGISRALKNMAKELNVPVIALSQLSRAVEVRGGSKRPQLSDLRECVCGDTLVWLADGRMVPVRNLVQQEPEVISVRPERQTLCIEQAGLVWPVGKRPVYKVKLASGRSIRATSEHRLYTSDGWTTIDTLRPQQRIAIARVLPEPSRPIHWDEHRLLLLAHLTGNGSYLKHQPIRYATASEANSKAVCHAAQRAFGVSVNRHKGRGKRHQLVFGGDGNRPHPAGMNAWLRSLGLVDQRSYQKHLPADIFRLGNEQIAFFLRHLWATDGAVFVPKQVNGRTTPRLVFSTDSERLSAEVATLLLRFGIVARIRTLKKGNYRPVYAVELSGKQDQATFMQHIGAFGEKTIRTEKRTAWLAGKKANTNPDTILPEIADALETGIQYRGISQHRTALLRQSSFGGSAQFDFAPPPLVLPDHPERFGGDILRNPAGSDLFWDSVLSVEADGTEEVYDLSVPKTEAWFANGILSHNSGAIEQDADIVSFIYRPEYYGILEDEQGQSLKGVAEFIVAKHRHGALDTVKLKFTDQFAKFGNLDDPAFAGLRDPLTGPFSPSTITMPSRMNDEDIPF